MSTYVGFKFWHSSVAFSLQAKPSARAGLARANNELRAKTWRQLAAVLRLRARPDLPAIRCWLAQARRAALASLASEKQLKSAKLG